MITATSFVLFPLGDRRFALPADRVAELARPGRLQQFPHTTPQLSGVILRRGHIVPVCDIAPLLIGPKSPPRRFYLIAQGDSNHDQWTAIPVTGECELASCEAGRPAGNAPPYVTAVLARGEELVPVIDLGALMTQEVH